ncbi:MAG: hypothetical protein NTV34_03710 [Proteobacteria bacterium]|nr:hypothetical protein [Pseudomonadota bacterium]
MTMKFSSNVRSDAARKLASVSGVTLLEGSAPYAEIVIKGGIGKTTLDLTPWCPIGIVLGP